LSTKKTERIGIFGGAFNPIHNGHLFVAKESISKFSLSKIIFVPTGNPVFSKEDLLDKRERFALCKLAIRGEKSFEISDFEVKNEKPSYYIETLKHYKSENIEIFSILGEDAFIEFHRWKEYQEIFRNCYFIVAERFEDNFITTKAYINEKFSEYKNKIFFLPHPLYRVSSTLLRKRIKSGLNISYLLPKEVEKEILKNKFYK